MNPPSRRGRPGTVAAALALLLSLAGCQGSSSSTGPPGASRSSTGLPGTGRAGTDPSDPETNSMSLDQTVRMLRSRPDIEQIMTAYNRLLTTLVNDLNAAGLTTKWTTIDPGDTAGCPDLFGAQALLNAESRTTDSLGSIGSIPDADWPAARKIVERDAAAEGFDDTQVIKDQPGDHDIFIHGRYGSVLQFGVQKNSVLGITSGCHRVPGKPIDPNHPDAT